MKRSPTVVRPELIIADCPSPVNRRERNAVAGVGWMRREKTGRGERIRTSSTGHPGEWGDGTSTTYEKSVPSNPLDSPQVSPRVSHTRPADEDCPARHRGPCGRRS
jgi:hypothetical protein